MARHWIGIERDPEYAKAAKERIDKVRPVPTSALEMARSKRSEPRVPFGALIELGILEPGSALYDERRRFRAEVRADGTVAWGGEQGSIHRIGAAVQGKAACNGWTFWHFEAQGQLKPIDTLREMARQRLGLAPSQPIVIAAE